MMIVTINNAAANNIELQLYMIIMNLVLNVHI